MAGARERKVTGSYDEKSKVYALTFKDGKAVTFKLENFPRSIQERAVQDGLFQKLRPAATSVEALQAAVDRLKAGTWAQPKMGKPVDPRNLLIAAIVFMANAENKVVEELNEKGRTIRGANAARLQLKSKDAAFIAKALATPKVVKALAAMQTAPKKQSVTVDTMVA